MKTREKIVRLLNRHHQLSIHELCQILGASRQYVHRVINDLEEDGIIQKWGKVPHVYYALIQKSGEPEFTPISYDQEEFLNKHFFLIDAAGTRLKGIDGISYWCMKQEIDIHKTIQEYITTRSKYLDYISQTGFIDGLPKLHNTKGIGKIGVDALYYLDFYAIERFGKTRLGTLMHYAKQGQNKTLMTEIASDIKQRVYNLIETEKVDAILFVPPTIGRKVQIMHVMEKLLNIQLPKVQITKIKTEIVIPQKALSKLFERKENAKNTFHIPEQNSFEHVLILDDAVGSGTTINEIALKIKDKNLSKRISGLAITGSFKGFEVISEL
jgi:hypothetical protein